MSHQFRKRQGSFWSNLSDVSFHHEIKILTRADDSFRARINRATALSSRATDFLGDARAEPSRNGNARWKKNAVKSRRRRRPKTSSKARQPTNPHQSFQLVVYLHKTRDFELKSGKKRPEFPAGPRRQNGQELVGGVDFGSDASASFVTSHGDTDLVIVDQAARHRDRVVQIQGRLARVGLTGPLGPRRAARYRVRGAGVFLRWGGFGGTGRVGLGGAGWGGWRGGWFAPPELLRRRFALRRDRPVTFNGENNLNDAWQHGGDNCR